MKTKLEMAHEWYMKHSEIPSFMNTEVEMAWDYADAMQAEADKRNKAEAEQKRKAIREMINADNTFLEKEGQHFDDMQWQPDWSQAPDWANWWVKTMGDSYLWCMHEPIMNDDYFRAVAGSNHAPSFGYTGDWRDSLRKRPN